ncbi:Arylamine N-acetyltransferase [Orpheovirus IHUMI-LCC2]|uniref:Arylamine N-acetyltransferase n=1 Tax=Orpheovirus IHUMI-LCC2 TaxID=2023057 RepID=A0A2I2L327_9VIRU|nr:Arylamine N-acetyltransferase [Orpheovirus IHUMI-LCC2]SNW61917.1 Arylamine N-acetyltransferase [Orpheovirus IHUMI-LCC2]
MQKLIKAIYYHPLSGSSNLHNMLYKCILRFQNTPLLRYCQNSLINNTIKEAQSIPAFKEIYNGLERKSLKGLPLTNKGNFHIAFPNLKDRLIKDRSLADCQILKTSGSTSGKPSEIPVSQEDINRLRNYYILLGKASGGIFPQNYKYINMFPISNSSTGKYSELLIPEEYRLGRSDADPIKTKTLISDNMQAQVIHTNTNLVLSGLPILHLNFLSHIEENKEIKIIKHLKERGICLYGGESPSITEKLKLYSSYKQLVGLYGSTELGPRLGFSLDLNLVLDIALHNKEVLREVSNSNVVPITFFYDKYLNNYEIVNNSLVNTPLIQQTELKIRWDQDDYCEIISPSLLIHALKKHHNILSKSLSIIDEEYNVNLKNILEELIDGNKYEQLIKYFGMILFYGRKGILFGGSNLDNKFAEDVFEEVKKKVRGLHYLALYKHDDETVKEKIALSNYSGLRLDILLEIEGEVNDDEVKKEIISIMRSKHCDFDAILHYYEVHNKINEVMDNIKLHIYDKDSSPMHFRFINSKKRNYIIKKLTEDEIHDFNKLEEKYDNNWDGYCKLLYKNINNDMNELDKLRLYFTNHITNFMFSNKEYFEKENMKVNFHKIIEKVMKRRYGICMELNFMFNRFLNENGYNSKLVKCYKPNHEGDYYNIFHTAIIVEIMEMKYFVDVGFGEYFDEPKLLDDINMIDNVKVVLCEGGCHKIYNGDKEILKIVGDVELEEVIENYSAFFNGGNDFPLCKFLFERIYNLKDKVYCIPS